MAAGLETLRRAGQRRHALLAPARLNTSSAGPGRSLYVRDCAKCHGALGSRIPAAPLNSTTFAAARDDEALHTAIEQGKETMPAFGKDFGGPLSSEEVEDVIRYVRILSGNPVGARDATAGEPDPGQEVFVSACSGCHGAAGDLIATADLTSPELWSSRSDDELISEISDGTGGMPPQSESSGGSLSSDEVKAVVAYLRQASGVSGEGAAVPPGVLKAPPAGTQDLFQTNCAGCHGGLSLPEVDPIRIHEIIRDGLPDQGMPAFGDRLSEEEIGGLASLVASGEAAAGDRTAVAGAEGNPFAGVVRHVDGWISKHPGVVREQGSQLCQKCHEVSVLCFSCHASKARQIAYEYAHPPFAQGDCTSCHDPHQSSLSTLLRVQPPELCLGCHEATVGRVQRVANVHLPFLRGECTACHTPHASNVAGQLRGPVAQVCMSCHDAGSSHLDPEHPHVAQGLCVSCHEPHGGDKGALLRDTGGSSRCLSCHRK